MWTRRKKKRIRIIRIIVLAISRVLISYKGIILIIRVLYLVVGCLLSNKLVLLHITHL